MKGRKLLAKISRGGAAYLPNRMKKVSEMADDEAISCCLGTANILRVARV